MISLFFHKSSTALRNSRGRGQALHFGMAAKMKGMTPTVDPASPAHRLDARTSARSSFARYEFGKLSHSLGSEICGLVGLRGIGSGQIGPKLRRFWTDVQAVYFRGGHTLNPAFTCTIARDDPDIANASEILGNVLNLVPFGSGHCWVLGNDSTRNAG